MVDFHFFWVGPPATDNYRGMDVIGPKLTKETYSRYKVNLWCLNAYHADYKAFARKNDIELRGIEDYLADICENKIEASDALKADAFRLKSLITTKVARAESPEMPPEDKAREYVTIKALMQLYLQNFEDGYFLDSNIIPASDFPTEPIVLEKFSAPIIPKRESFHSLPSWTLFFTCDLDPWLMYSPTDDRSAKKRFDTYIDTVLQAERRYIEEGIMDRVELGQAFISAAKPSFFDEEGIAMRENLEALAHNYTPTTVKFLGFVKRYANSHRVRLTQRLPLLFTASTEEAYNLREIEHYLQAGHSILADTSGRTILKEILFRQNKELLDILLTRLKPKERELLFSSSTSFLDYLHNGPPESECLKALVVHYIDHVFGTKAAFMDMVVKVRLILQQKVHEDVSANQDEMFDSVFSSWMITASRAKNGTLATALDIVTQLGPLTLDNATDYCEKIRTAIHSPRLSTSGFFPPACITDEFVYNCLAIKAPKLKRARVELDVVAPTIPKLAHSAKL
jgi:hypothetical protein